MAAPKTLKNTVNPLSFNVPIADGSGKPTDEFTRKWLQQARTNASIPDLTTAAKVSAYLDLIGSTPGMLLERGATQWGGLASPADATKFLNGAAFPAYAQVKDSDLSLSDITTNNATTARHGFVPKLPNDATKFYNGVGAFAVPASGGGGAASIQDNGTTVYIALSDTDGQLVLDGSGDPVFSPEVFPSSAIPALPYAPSAATGLLTALTSSQNISLVTITPVLFGIPTTDTMGAYNPANGRFTPTIAGYYFISAALVFLVATGTISDTRCFISKNGLSGGGGVGQSTGVGGVTGNPIFSTTVAAQAFVFLNGTTDFIEIDGYLNAPGATVPQILSSGPLTFLTAFRIGS